METCDACGCSLASDEGYEVDVDPDGTARFLCETCYAEWREQPED